MISRNDLDDISMLSFFSCFDRIFWVVNMIYVMFRSNPLRLKSMSREWYE